MKPRNTCLRCGQPCHGKRCFKCHQLWRGEVASKNPRSKRGYALKYKIKANKCCALCGKLINKSYTHCRQCYGRLKSGDKANYWKGGRVTTGKKGYIRIYKPGHPRANQNKYVLEHILVWEQAHGKPLPDGWMIHHLNGIKDDNRIINLVALPAKKHYLILQAKAKRIQELEALLNGQHQLL